MSVRQSTAKRVLDVVLSLAGIILSVPVTLIIVVFIFLFLNRPVIFVQERAGLDGRPFRLYKFRTMREVTNASGGAVDDDVRLGRFGRLLRHISVDELPQLWNVLKGDMSLVGPRPLLVEYVSLYTQHQRRRLSVKPGLTGWAQIHGRNALRWEEKFAYDLWYIDHWTLGLDLKILGITILRTLSARGVSKPGYATTPRFTGTQILGPDAQDHPGG
jgi:sugar transferase EpsL